MMYEYIVATLRDAYCGKDASGVGEHVAIQFNVWGEGHGALYLEIADGAIHVEPYEYYDRDTIVYTDAQTLLAIAAGKIDPVTYGDLYVEGDRSRLEILRDISVKPVEQAKDPETVDEKPAKKPAKKRTTRKKSKSHSSKAAAAGEKVLKTAEEAAKTAKGAAKTAKGAAKTAKEAAGEVAKTARGAAESVKEHAGSVKEKAESVKKKAEDVVHSIRKDV